jgi:hypothetical protein
MPKLEKTVEFLKELKALFEKYNAEIDFTENITLSRIDMDIQLEGEDLLSFDCENSLNGLFFRRVDEWIKTNGKEDNKA